MPKRWIAPICLLFLASLSGYGQALSGGGGSGGTFGGAGVPTNPCTQALTLYQNTGNGDLYTCPVAGGNWVKWPTAGATSSQGSVGAFQIAAAAGAFAGTVHFSYTSPTISSDASGVIDLHLAGSGGLLLPGALSSGFVRVVTATGAISGGELSGDCVTAGSLVVTCAPFLRISNNLSELTATASTARTNLGLGTSSTHAATDFALAFTGVCGATHLVAGNSSCLATANSSVWVTDGSGNPLVSTTLPSGLTIPGYQLTSGKDAANGYAGLDASSLINTAECPTATTSIKGCLSAADWTTFNGKQASLGFTPLNPANNLGDVSSASSSRVSLGLGAFNGIRRANGASADTQAVAGTDYQAPLGFTAENIANKDVASGYAGLTAGGLLKAAELPFPAVATLGGVFSKDCSSGGQVLQKINTDGSVTCAAPLSFTAENVANKDAASGYAGLTAGSLLKAAEMPLPAVAALGGVFSKDCSATPGQMLQKINTDGSETCTAPFYWLVGSGGTSQTQRHRTNFIQGSNVTLTVADNSGTDSTDVTIASTGGGGGGTNYQTVESAGSAVTQRATLNFGAEFTTVDNSGAVRTDVSINSIANTKITGLGTASTHAATDFALAFTGTCTSSGIVRADGACVTTLPSGLTIPGYQASLGFVPLNPANNLSEVTAATARTNLGLVIGTNVEAWAANLDTYAGKTPPAGAVVGTTDVQTLTNKGVDGASATELGYVAGATSAIQTQLNGKQASLGFTAENAANKDAASGYAGLTAGSLLKLAEFPTTLTGINAATATALAANGTNCSAGSPPLGVDASGNAESCTALTAAQVTNAFNLAAANSLGAFAETMTDITTPSNPSAGATKFYTKAGTLCSLSPAGVETCTGSSPLTTKGDLLGFGTVPIRVPIGSTNGLVLTQDSTATAGFSWQAGGTNVAFQLSGAVIANSTTFNFVPGSGIVATFTNVGGVATLSPAFNTALIPTHDTIHANENFPTLTSTGVTALTYTSANKTIASCTTGMTYQFYTDTANPVSISIDSGCAMKSIKLADGSTSPSTGTILAASYFAAIYDGTVFRLMGGAGGSQVYPGAGIANSTGSAWGTSITTSAGLFAAISDVIGSGFLLGSTNAVLTNPALALGSSPLGITWTVGTGGVTANTLVQADASTPAKIVASTTGSVGISLDTASAAATARIADVGIVNCITDTGGATAGDLVIQGTGTVIDCKDSGQTVGANIPITTRIIGIFRSTATAGNPALVQLSPNSFGTQLFGGNTLTLAGNVTFTGAFNPTFAIPATGTYTLAVGTELVSGGPLGTPLSATLTNATGLPITGIANIAANSFLGNNTGSSGAVLALTATQATAALNVFTSSLNGLAPSSGGGTTNFLRADGTWAVPPSGGMAIGGTITSGTTNAVLYVASGPILAQTSAVNGALLNTNSSGVPGLQTSVTLGVQNTTHGQYAAAGSTGVNGSFLAYGISGAPGYGELQGDTILGGILSGSGSTNDLTLQNKSGTSVCTVATGTTTLTCASLGVSGLTATSLNGLAVTTSTGTLTVLNGTTLTNPIHQYGASFGTPGGAALTTGGIQYFNMPQSCTIGGYEITADAGTATVKFWKIATGTAIPTSANSISTAGVSLGSGTHIYSTTVTDFTTTAVSANDIGAVTLTAVSGAGYVQAVMLCQ